MAMSATETAEYLANGQKLKEEGNTHFKVQPSLPSRFARADAIWVACAEQRLPQSALVLHEGVDSAAQASIGLKSRDLCLPVSGVLVGEWAEPRGPGCDDGRLSRGQEARGGVRFGGTRSAHHSMLFLQYD